MAEETNGIPGTHEQPPLIRIADEWGRLLPITEEEHRLWIEQGHRAIESLSEITDGTDTDELWDEVLRNLGVDPATGRGLGS